MILVLLVSMFSGCTSLTGCFIFANPDEPFEGVDFVEQYNYVYFPLNIKYKRGEVLGQAYNKKTSKHELYYIIEGVDPEVMVYIQKGSEPSSMLYRRVEGLFYNPDKIDLLLDAFCPSGMRLVIKRSEKLPEEDSYDSYTHRVWMVTQEVWDAWKTSFHASLAENTKMYTDAYREKQLSLYQELEKQILLVDEAVIKDFGCQLIQPSKECENLWDSPTYSFKTEEGFLYRISLSMKHYQPKGIDYITLDDMHVDLKVNEDGEWFWYFERRDKKQYAILLNEEAKAFLSTLLRDIDKRVEEGDTQKSGELFDFWSKYFPEDKLPPVFDLLSLPQN